MQSLIITLLFLVATAAATTATTKPETTISIHSKQRRDTAGPPPRSTDGVKYTVTCRAGKSPGGAVFLNHIGTPVATQAMASATQFVLNLFNETHPSDRRNVKRIALFVDNMKGRDALDAYTTRNEIHVNANFLAKYKGNIRREFVGIVYHQVTKVWQWTGGKEKEAPKGLLTGVAEFVRMEAHYGTTEKVKPGEGKQWDQGFGVTARFLAHCERAKKGFVKELNKKMRYGYTKAYFVEILGKPVDQLWKEYKGKYAKAKKH